MQALGIAPRADKAVARSLHAAAVGQARCKALYASMGVADTPEGRFEAMTLHIVLLLDRLRAAGPAAATLRQRVFDVFIADLDGALREMGVGDLSVPRRMRRLGEAFYGRAKGLDAAFARLPDLAALTDALARTALEDRPAADAASLTAYVLAVRSSLAGQEDGDILQGRVRWPSL